MNAGRHGLASALRDSTEPAGVDLRLLVGYRTTAVTHWR
jgi:hypothetical protein